LGIVLKVGKQNPQDSFLAVLRILFTGKLAVDLGKGTALNKLESIVC
jgi:hypothetical protein